MSDDTPPSRVSPWFWVAVVLVILALPVACFVAVSGIFRHVAAERVETPGTRRLATIGQALRAYAQDHGGGYPPSLSALARAQHLPDDLPTCPSDAPGGPFEYVYQGRDLAEQTTPNGSVLAYEPPAANGDAGSHLLYADGRLEWVAMANLRDELERTPARPPQPQEP